jgi:hypothetical protein
MKFALFLLWFAATAAAQPSTTVIQELAGRAYNFAYALVLMEHTRRASGPANWFAHRRDFPDPSARTIVRPNADTLYSTAWLDLSNGPLVLHLPDTKGRYYLVQFLDAWTETFFVPGKRTTGTGEQSFLITGPGERGSVPPQMKRVESPTNMVWLLGRTQTNGPDDYAAVHEIQNGFSLTPLSQSQEPAARKLSSRDAVPPPVQVARLAPLDFLREFAELLARNPPHTGDEPMMRDLARIGIEPGKPFRPEALSKPGLQALISGMQDAAARLEELARRGGKPGPTGWFNMGQNAGQYGTDYQARALVARTGLGALPPADAVYWSCAVDAGGAALDGNNSYRMHFPKDALPPVRAFWSLAMYDQAGYFVDHPIRRFSIGDRDALRYNEDGSLDLYLGSRAPGGPKDANWLPAPAAKFNLIFRLYWRQMMWSPPAVMSDDERR